MSKELYIKMSPASRNLKCGYLNIYVMYSNFQVIIDKPQPTLKDTLYKCSFICQTLELEQWSSNSVKGKE